MKRAGILAAALGLLAILCLCLVVIGVPLTSPLRSNIRTQCTVGVVGTSASITVQGLWAGRTCNEIVNGSPQDFYEASQPPTQPVICEYSHNRQRVIVRDEGLLKLVGNSLCQSFSASIVDDAHRVSATAQAHPPTPPTAGGITDVAVATTIGADNRPLASAKEVPLGREVYITCTVKQMKGQKITTRITRDGTPIEFKDNSNVFTPEKDTVYYSLQFRPQQKGTYTAELVVDDELTPRNSVTFRVN